MRLRAEGWMETCGTGDRGAALPWTRAGQMKPRPADAEVSGCLDNLNTHRARGHLSRAKLSARLASWLNYSIGSPAAFRRGCLQPPFRMRRTHACGARTRDAARSALAGLPPKMLELQLLLFRQDQIET